MLGFWRQWGPAIISGSLCIGVVAFLWVIGDHSYRPSPSLGISESNPPQAKGADSDQRAEHDQRDTTSPFVEKTVRTPKTEQETARERAEANEKAAADRWSLWFVGLTALFTGCMFLVGFAQAILFLWQLRLIHASLADTKVAAEAAKIAAEGATLQAKALIAIERPIVTITEMVLRAPHIPFLDDDGPLVSRFPDPFARIVVTFQNAGRTAATTKRLCLNWEIAKSLPTEPVYKNLFNDIIDIDSVIQSGGTLIYTPKMRGIITSPEQLKMLEEGIFSLWVYGFLEFEDFLETKYVYGFRRLWVVPRGFGFVQTGFVSEGQSPYEYYRKEDKR